MNVTAATVPDMGAPTSLYSNGRISRTVVGRGFRSNRKRPARKVRSPEELPARSSVAESADIGYLIATSSTKSSSDKMRRSAPRAINSSALRCLLLLS